MTNETEGAQRLEEAVASLEGAVGGIAARLQEVSDLKRRNTALEQEVSSLRSAQDAVSQRLDKAIEQLKSLIG